MDACLLYTRGDDPNCLALTLVQTVTLGSERNPPVLGVSLGNTAAGTMFGGRVFPYPNSFPKPLALTCWC